MVGYYVWKSPRERVRQFSRDIRYPVIENEHALHVGRGEWGKLSHPTQLNQKSRRKDVYVLILLFGHIANTCYTMLH